MPVGRTPCFMLTSHDKPYFIPTYIVHECNDNRDRTIGTQVKVSWAPVQKLLGIQHTINPGVAWCGRFVRLKVASVGACTLQTRGRGHSSCAPMRNARRSPAVRSSPADTALMHSCQNARRSTAKYPACSLISAYSQPKFAPSDTLRRLRDVPLPNETMSHHPIPDPCFCSSSCQKSKL